MSDLSPLPRLEPGRYRHFKGGLYEVIDIVRSSETLQPQVLYRALYGETGSSSDHWAALHLTVMTMTDSCVGRRRGRRPSADAIHPSQPVRGGLSDKYEKSARGCQNATPITSMSPFSEGFP